MILQLGHRTSGVLYYDEHCNLCLWFVGFVKKRDHRNLISFQPIQGTQHEQEQLESCGCLLSMVFCFENKCVTHDESVRQIMFRLGKLWPVVAVVGSIVPSFFRRSIYNYVAKHRYQWFGKRV